MTRLRSKLTYANVMATIAVFLVLAGGTAFAASQMLPKNSVGSKQIKKAAVTPAKLSKAAKAALTGPQGATGPQGPKGETGQVGKPSGDYFAMVNQTAAFIGEHPGFTSVSRIGTGTYCLGVQAGVSYYDPIASVEWLNSSEFASLVEPIGQEKQFACGAGQLEVRTYEFEPHVTASNEVSFTVTLPQK
jgi:hypothetical protein